MRKKFIISFILIVCSLFIFGVFYATKDFPKERSIEFINEGFGGDLDKRVLHRETVENGVILFYDEQNIENSLGTRFIKKQLLGWQATYDRGGFTWIDRPDGFQKKPIKSEYFPSQNSEQSPFPILLGAIKDPSIERVVVSYEDDGKEKEVHAKTVKAHNKSFYFLSVPPRTNSTVYKVKGYTEDGDLVGTEEVQSISHDSTDG